MDEQFIERKFGGLFNAPDCSWSEAGGTIN